MWAVAAADADGASPPSVSSCRAHRDGDGGRWAEGVLQRQEPPLRRQSVEKREGKQPPLPSHPLEGGDSSCGVVGCVCCASAVSLSAAVPILIPHVNASHLGIVRHQQKVKGYDKGGFIVTNANCSSTGLVIALKVTHTQQRQTMRRR